MGSRIKFAILFLTLVGLIYSCFSNQKEKEVFNNHIGKYIMDIERTDLKDYSYMREELSKVTIEFFPDSTFQMNRKIPFMLDSVGRWVAVDGSPYDY